MTMQNLVLAVQNQVSPTDLGSASSTVTFFRSLGGAMGVSALGAFMATRITHYMKDGLTALGPKGAAMASGNSSGSDQIPDLSKIPEPIRSILESSYGHGIADVFLIAAPLAALGLIIVLFIKEVPLRTTGALAQEAAENAAPEETAELAELTELAAAGAEEGLPELPKRERVPSWAGVPAASDEYGRQHLAAVASAATGNGSGGDTAVGGIRVHGFVRGTEGKPVARAAVTLISMGGRQLGRAMAHIDGGYQVDAPGAGSYVLIASADGYQPQASTVLVGDAIAGGVAFDILLSGTSGLTGVVQEAENGSPVSGAVVIVTDARGDVLATGTTGDQGDFTFAELVPGAVTVAVNAPGRRPTALPVEISGTGITRIEIPLSSGAGVNGVVRAAGAPLNDARVTLVDAAGNVVASATTGADGEYAFADLDEGEYTVIATGYPPVASGVWVTGSGIDQHDVQLSHPTE